MIIKKLFNLFNLSLKNLKSKKLSEMDDIYALVNSIKSRTGLMFGRSSAYISLRDYIDKNRVLEFILVHSNTFNINKGLFWFKQELEGGTMLNIAQDWRIVAEYQLKISEKPNIYSRRKTLFAEFIEMNRDNLAEKINVMADIILFYLNHYGHKIESENPAS